MNYQEKNNSLFYVLIKDQELEILYAHFLCLKLKYCAHSDLGNLQNLVSIKTQIYMKIQVTMNL